MSGAIGIAIAERDIRRKSSAEAAARERLRSAEAKLAAELARDTFHEPSDLYAKESEGVKSGEHLDADAFEPEVPLKGKLEDRLALSALWEVTHSRLDLYHQIATGQARSSFFTAQVATGVGFVLLVVFALLSARTHTTAGAITTGSLGAVSAALAGYIGRTFVRSQEAAANHLRAYFDQPLEFSKYLAAERLLASGSLALSSEQQAAILTALIEGVLSYPVQAGNKRD
jgi:hypothetical protein